MDAGHLDGGFNGNIGGISLGADYTFENALRAGVALSLGGGYAVSAGDFADTTNSMSYWGVEAYAGWRYKDFALMADAGYTGSFPKGMDTYLYKDIDKDGVDVSGGEAQKIAIARALYKDAPFIILDEPTAALDPIAEAEIYSKFDDIAGDRTAVYISHRLSSCKFCDEIAVFDGGQVVQKGSHESLLADTSGRYAELWNAQAQYYTEEEERRLL